MSPDLPGRRAEIENKLAVTRSPPQRTSTSGPRQDIDRSSAESRLPRETYSNDRFASSSGEDIGFGNEQHDYSPPILNGFEPRNVGPEDELHHFTDGKFGSRAHSISEQLLPFRCSADIVGLDGSSQELSVSLFLKVAPISSGPNGDGQWRSLCRVTAEQFEGRITSLDRTNQTALRLQEVQLIMGPSMEGFEGPEHEAMRYQRSFYAISQKPKCTNVVMKDSSVGRDHGIGGKLGYPLGVSIEGSYKRSTWITRPAESAGLDYKALVIDCVSRNQLLWKYGIGSGTEFTSEPLLNRSATFRDHTGDFSYLSNKLPCSIRIEITLVCRLPTLSLPGRLLNGSFIRHKETNYPCRDIRLNLKVNILPTEVGIFLYPRNGSSGKCLDLGNYQFVNQNGHLCLDISRDAANIRITNPHLRGRPHSWQHGSWSAKGKEVGELEMRETCADREICPTAGELQLKVTNTRK